MTITTATANQTSGWSTEESKLSGWAYYGQNGLIVDWPTGKCRVSFSKVIERRSIVSGYEPPEESCIKLSARGATYCDLKLRKLPENVLAMRRNLARAFKTDQKKLSALSPIEALTVLIGEETATTWMEKAKLHWPSGGIPSPFWEMCSLLGHCPGIE